MSGFGGHSCLSDRPDIILPVQPGDGWRPYTSQDWILASLLEEELCARIEDFLARAVKRKNHKKTST